MIFSIGNVYLCVVVFKLPRYHIPHIWICWSKFVAVYELEWKFSSIQFSRSVPATSRLYCILAAQAAPKTIPAPPFLPCQMLIVQNSDSGNGSVIRSETWSFLWNMIWNLYSHLGDRWPYIQKANKFRDDKISRQYDTCVYLYKI